LWTRIAETNLFAFGYGTSAPFDFVGDLGCCGGDDLVCFLLRRGMYDFELFKDNSILVCLANGAVFLLQRWIAQQGMSK
jgi:hypothetical protein